MKKQFGIEIFSGFSGWALANNAVSVIPYIVKYPVDEYDKPLISRLDPSEK